MGGIKWNPVKDLSNAASHITKQATNAINHITGGTSHALADITKGGKKFIDSANRGEVGKFTSGLADTYKNVVVAPYTLTSDVIQGRDVGKRAQEISGSALNVNSYGSLDYLGGSKGAKKFLTSTATDDATFGLSTDYFSEAHGIRTLGREGELSNYDRNYILQGGVKAAAIGTGVAAASYLTAGSSAAAPIVPLGAAPVAAAPVAAAPAASGLGLGSYLGLGSAGVAASVLTGKKSAGQGISEILTGGGISDPGNQDGFLDIISGLIPKSNNPIARSESEGFLPSAPAGMSPIVPAAAVLLIGAVFILKYKRVI